MKTAPIIIVQLIHIEGPLKGQIVELSDHEIKIGRHPSCQLQYPPDLAIISRQHATILREGNRFKIIDQSSNGTIVNGRRVTEIFLKDGDVITVSEGGPKVSFLTQVTNTPIAAPEIPQPPPPAPPKPVTSPPPPPLQTPKVETPKVTTPPQVEPQRVEPVAVTPQPIIPQKNKVPLIIQYGPTLQAFDELPLQIGRHPNSGFLLDHPNILDLHAEIFYAEEKYYIRDLTGQQMIRSNGVAADQGVALRPNDVIAFSLTGPFFRFLGDGRLSEEEIEAEDPLEKGSDSMSKDSENTENLKGGKKPMSFFKKVFSRDS